MSTMELALICDFQSLSSFSFQLLFLSGASFFVNSRLTIYRPDRPGVLHRIRRARLHAHLHSGICFSLINRWKNRSTRSRFTDMMSYCLWHLRDIIPPLITVLLSNFANPPSALGFVIGAGITLPDVLASLHCLRVSECILFSHLPSSERQRSSVPVVLLSHESLICQLEWDSDHPHPTNSLFHLTTSLLLASGPFQSPLPIFVRVSIHISHQHRRSRFSGSVSSFLFWRSSYLIIWHSKFTVCCGPSSNFGYSGYIKNVVDDDDDDDTSLVSAEVPRRDHWQPHVLWNPRQSCRQGVQLPHSCPVTRA